MAKFKIVLDRCEYLTTTIEVEAETLEQAEEQALENCWNDDVDWDCYDSDGPDIDNYSSHEVVE